MHSFIVPVAFPWFLKLSLYPLPMPIGMAKQLLCPAVDQMLLVKVYSAVHPYGRTIGTLPLYQVILSLVM